MSDPRIVALVPMRHDSERVPGKNYRDFHGAPLYHHIVKSLLRCAHIAEVVIDTDSPFVMKDAPEHFPEVRLLERPDELRDGTTPMNDVLLNDVDRVDADYYLQTHSTNPLLSDATISSGIEAFLGSRDRHDSMFSVTRLQTRLWDADTRPLNHDPSVLIRTQDLEPVFEENSCMYIFSRNSLKSHASRIGSSPLMFEIDPAEAWDIDEELDFAVAQFLHASNPGPGATR